MENKKKLTSGGVRIPYTEVVTMVKTYHDYCKRHPDYPNYLHIKSVWFSIDDINSICDALNNEGADGLRIYLGRYPADVSGFKDPIPTPNTNSVVLVSTGLDDYGNPNPHYDYFINEEHMEPINRGEQCQPNCNGVTVDKPN